ncbi:MAG: hypothetical protein WCT39_04165 [Candidatus Margulisiibacteriota bacterium]
MFTGDTNFKKLYYYVLCIMAFFVLMWGAIDLTSTTFGLVGLKGSSQMSAPPTESQAFSPDKGEQGLDAFYQSKMLYDRLWDSLARVLIAGGIFIYCRKAVEKVEG